MSDAMLLSIQVGLPTLWGDETASDPIDRPWTSAIVKTPVQGPVWLGLANLTGDRQADLKAHGGPDKAVNIYASEHYPYWRTELALPEMPFGAFGENFTTQGWLENEVCIGDVYQVGEAVVQVSQPRGPCWKLGRRWRVEDLADRVRVSGRTGWYLRVQRGGYVEAGLPLQLTERPYPQWTITLANDLMYAPKVDRAQIEALAECPLLAASWRESLARRATSA